MSDIDNNLLPLLDIIRKSSPDLFGKFKAMAQNPEADNFEWFQDHLIELLKANAERKSELKPESESEPEPESDSDESEPEPESDFDESDSDESDSDESDSDESDFDESDSDESDSDDEDEEAEEGVVALKSSTSDIKDTSSYTGNFFDCINCGQPCLSEAHEECSGFPFTSSGEDYDPPNVPPIYKVEYDECSIFLTLVSKDKEECLELFNCHECEWCLQLMEIASI